MKQMPQGIINTHHSTRRGLASGQWLPRGAAHTSPVFHRFIPIVQAAVLLCEGRTGGAREASVSAAGSSPARPRRKSQW